MLLAIGLILFTLSLTDRFEYECQKCHKRYKLGFLGTMVSRHGRDASGSWAISRCPHCRAVTKARSYDPMSREGAGTQVTNGPFFSSASATPALADGRGYVNARMNDRYQASSEGLTLSASAGSRRGDEGDGHRYLEHCPRACRSSIGKEFGITW